MKINVFFLVCFVLLLSACGTSVYAPINEVMDPVSKEKELNTSVTFNHGSSERYQFGVCYSPINSLAINYSGIFSRVQNTQSLALGYYKPFSIKSENQYAFYDFYTGFTTGQHNDFENVYITGGSVLYKLLGEGNQYFGQTGIHLKIRKIQFDLNFKLNFMDWKKFTVFGDKGTFSEFVNYDVSKIDKIYESGMKFTFTDGTMKVYTGLNISYFDSLGFYDYGNYFTGISYDIGQLIYKKRLNQIK